MQHLTFDVACKEHLDNKVTRYVKAPRVEPAFVKRAYPCTVSAGKPCAASRCWARAAKVVVADQDRTADKRHRRGLPKVLVRNGNTT